MRRFRLVGLLLFTLALALIAGASGCDGSDAANQLSLAPESDLPDFVKGQPAQVKIAYRFAMANPDVLSQFPCYCGCGNVGHKNNLDCYVKSFNSDGTVAEFDTHAFG